MNSDRPIGEAARAGFFVQSQAIDAAYSQLIGLCRGVLADNHLADSEIVALDQWMSTYLPLLPKWPARHLAERIREVLVDGVIDDDERSDLTRFIAQAAGIEGTERFDLPTTLPLTRPAPHVEFDGKRFCLTGTFVFGPRKLVVSEIAKWGGEVVDSVGRADFLIIGACVSVAWKFTTHGRKIEEAVALAESGRRIAIISEQHWNTCLC